MWCAGDRLLKRYVVAMPDLQEQQLSSQDDALILASDGLWDVLANQDAAQLIKDIKVGAGDTFHGFETVCQQCIWMLTFKVDTAKFFESSTAQQLACIT